ncbi:protein YgfX [Pantoea vagans]|uniref:protein YgfX n=1 Tax=Pantoea vagans TaxID=470934 RepID=UPI0023B12F9C|nr:protein YgfX [Pantoea vagans]MDE8557335.1 protein YgfX [Pantoea vagans]MDE8577749.1 protein YgfX [Pantoea vagans]
MIVARWQCKLRPSRLACGCLCVWLVAAVPGVMLMTLPVGGWLIKTPVILLMLAEGWRCFRRLIRRHGTLQRESVHCWIWQGKRWRPTQPLRWLPIGVLLVAKSEQGAMLRLWLMQDNMQPDEWRALRSSCFSKARH